MRKLLWAGVGMCMGLTACAGSGLAVGNAYRPAIIEQGINAARYESDRQACEALVQRAPANHEPTNVIRFRQCLLDKGYRLLS